MLLLDYPDELQRVHHYEDEELSELNELATECGEDIGIECHGYFSMIEKAKDDVLTLKELIVGLEDELQDAITDIKDEATNNISISNESIDGLTDIRDRLAHARLELAFAEAVYYNASENQE